MRRSGPVQISGSGSTANEAHSIARARRVARQSLVFLSVYFWGSVRCRGTWIQGRAYKQPRRDRQLGIDADVMLRSGVGGLGDVLSTTDGRPWSGVGRVGSLPGEGGPCVLEWVGGASRVKRSKCFFLSVFTAQEKRAPVMPGDMSSSGAAGLAEPYLIHRKEDPIVDGRRLVPRKTRGWLRQ